MTPLEWHLDRPVNPASSTLTLIPRKRQRRRIDIAPHVQDEPAAGTWTQAHSNVGPLRRDLLSAHRGACELVFAVAAGLDDHRTRFQLIDVDQRYDNAIGAHF